MLKFEVSVLANKIFEIPKRLASVVRWSRWVRSGSEKENVLEHTFSQAFITILLCEELRRCGRISHQQSYRALACAIIHDIGEVEYGDKLDYLKTANDEKNERLYLYEYLEWLDENVREEIIDIYDVQEGAKRDDDVEVQNIENQVFGLAEKLCYFMYALRQFDQDPCSENAQDLMHHVSRRQAEGLQKRAQSLGFSSETFPFLKAGEVAGYATGCARD